MDESRPGYYAIIPADVRYDDQIPANAKLLYGEISALIGAEGYCYATNSYFMKIYGFSDPTVSRLIAALEKAGYVKRVMERDETGQIVRRKIYLSVSVPDIQPPIIFDTTSPQKKGEGPLKNDGENNLSITVIRKENKKEKSNLKKTPLTDEEQRALFADWIRANLGGLGDTDAMNAVYLNLIEYRDSRTGSKSPLNTKRKIDGLLADLLEGSEGSASVMCDMLKTATRRCWLGVYPPGGRKKPVQSNEGMKRTWI